MRTLASVQDRRAIFERIGKLTPADRRRWGKMKPEEMICHLADSFRMALAEKDTAPATGPVRRAMAKWVALKSPTKWPRGVPTRPEIKQGAGGTPPGDFEQDRAALLAAVERFCAAPPDERCPHPLFGPMNPAEWMRWGWQHADHHLRQFGR